MDLNKYYNLLLDFDQEARFEKLSYPLIYKDIGRKWGCLTLLSCKPNAYIERMKQSHSFTN